ncbi:peptidylprolyl isomerase [Candidatus Moduliflexota bacterium]
MKQHLPGTIIFFALLTALLSPAGAATVDGIAATVNGEVITLLDLEKTGRPLVEQQMRTALKRERGKLKRETLLTVLEGLVLQKLQLQRAKELGLGVSDQEVEEAIARIMEGNSLTVDMLERAIEKEGLTMEKYREQISEQILFSKLMQQEVRTRVAVTSEETEAYYDEHREEYFRPEQIRVRHILIQAEGEGEEALQETRRRALVILEEFREGADFSDLVMQYSPMTASGDETVSGWLKRGEFLQELEEVAFSLPAGSVSDPIRSKVGFHIIQVVEKEEDSYLSLEAVSDSIRQKLLGEKMERDYKSWLDELRAESHVEILY